MTVKYKIREILERHNLTPYRFQQESGLGLRTAYRLVNNETNTVNRETLTKAMRALRSMTGEDLQIADVLEYVEDGAEDE